jgi:hypothetical protein
MGEHRAMRRSRSIAEHLLRVFAYVVAVVGALTVLWAAGHATISLDPAFLGTVLILAGAAMLGGCRLMYGPSDGGRLRVLAGALAIPLLVVAMIVLVAIDLPLDWRWRAAKADFQSTVSSLQQNRPDPVPMVLGSYTIDRVDTIGSGYLFEDAHGGDLTDCGGGFAYLPHGEPSSDDDRVTDVLPSQLTFIQLDGAWYAWTCSS